jgi:hypothetical protein
MAASSQTTSVVLNWTAAGGSNSTGQQVQRTLYGANNYSTIATLGASAETYTDTTAVVDTVYEYKIVNICEVGGPTEGGRVNIVEITCVALTTNVSGLLISGEYGELLNDTAWDDFAIYDSTGNTLLQQLPTPSGQQPGDWSATDAGIDYNTSYIVRATLVAPNGTTKDCDVSVSTGSAPACDAPTNLSVSVAQS